MQGLLFQLMSTRARWLTERQAVLTQNVANADTPEYRPLDLKAASFKDLLARREDAVGGIGMVMTSTLHMAGQPPEPVEARADKVDGFETAPAGNAVVLDEQLQKLAETQADYELSTNLYRRQIGLFKTALGTQGS